MEDNEISDDDGFSFGSDITVEPDEDSQSSHRQIPKRIRWGGVTETDRVSGSGNGDGDRKDDGGESHNNKNSRPFQTLNSPPPLIPLDPPTSITSMSRLNDNRNQGSESQNVDMSGERNLGPRTILKGTRVIAPGSHDGSPLEIEHQPQNSTSTSTSINYNGNDNPNHTVSLWSKFFSICIQLLPAFCFTVVVQFVDLMVNIHLYLIGLIIFQSIFWPAFGFIVYSIKFPSSQNNAKIFDSLIPWSNGRWINTILLELHGLIVMGAVLLQLLSIRLLDITVSLTLSFLSIIILVLLQHIIREKKCSIELLTTTILGYTGVILVTIPSVLATHPYVQRAIYNGVAASIASSLLAIQSSFLLIYLRNQKMDDSLLVSSIGFNGTLFCVIAGCIVKVLGPVDKSNGGYIASIVLSTMLGVGFLLVKKVQGKISLLRQDKDNEDLNVDSNKQQGQNGDMEFISVFKLRVLIFLFCCFWGIFRQFYRQSFPTVYSVLGVTLIIFSFLFTMGFREWYAFMKVQKATHQRNDDEVGTSNESTQNQNEGPKSKRTTRFEFIPWLFSREPTLFISR